MHTYKHPTVYFISRNRSIAKWALAMQAMNHNAPMKPLLSHFTGGRHLIALIGLPDISRDILRQTWCLTSNTAPPFPCQKYLWSYCMNAPCHETLSVLLVLVSQITKRKQCGPWKVFLVFVRTRVRWTVQSLLVWETLMFMWHYCNG